MKTENKKLLFVSVVAIIAFLVGFAKAFFEYGASGHLSGLGIAFFIPVFYLILAVISLYLFHNPPFGKSPYIIMAVISGLSIVLMWGACLFLLLNTQQNGTLSYNLKLWYPIVLTVLLSMISICYISLTIDTIKFERKFKTADNGL